MTGFAREKGQVANVDWVWELRSVNGKGLDIRSRLPTGMDTLEQSIREILSKKFKRGSIQVNLLISRSEVFSVPVVNHQILENIIQLCDELQSKRGYEKPTVGELLSLKGVLEIQDSVFDEAAEATLHEALKAGLEVTACSLAEMRTTEGSGVAKILAGQVMQLAGLVKSIELNKARSPDAIRERLKFHIERLIDAGSSLDEQRLHQEAVVLAAKADLQEEIDRLKVHVESARELLGGDGPVGRKLDFLAQEFNRECNTICSKSNATEITTLGLDMKLVIDQFREQLQNLE